jgi:hypothetical protein
VKSLNHGVGDEARAVVGVDAGEVAHGAVVLLGREPSQHAGAGGGRGAAHGRAAVGPGRGRLGVVTRVGLRAGDEAREELVLGAARRREGAAGVTHGVRARGAQQEQRHPRELRARHGGGGAEVVREPVGLVFAAQQEPRGARGPGDVVAPHAAQAQQRGPELAAKPREVVVAHGGVRGAVGERREPAARRRVGRGRGLARAPPHQREHRAEAPHASTPGSGPAPRAGSPNAGISRPIA